MDVLWDRESLTTFIQLYILKFMWNLSTPNQGHDIYLFLSHYKLQNVQKNKSTTRSNCHCLSVLWKVSDLEKCILERPCYNQVWQYKLLVTLILFNVCSYKSNTFPDKTGTSKTEQNQNKNDKQSYLSPRMWHSKNRICQTSIWIRQVDAGEVQLLPYWACWGCHQSHCHWARTWEQILQNRS